MPPVEYKLPEGRSNAIIYCYIPNILDPEQKFSKEYLLEFYKSLILPFTKLFTTCLVCLVSVATLSKILQTFFHLGMDFENIIYLLIKGVVTYFHLGNNLEFEEVFSQRQSSRVSDMAKGKLEL